MSKSIASKKIIRNFTKESLKLFFVSFVTLLGATASILGIISLTKKDFDLTTSQVIYIISFIIIISLVFTLITIIIKLNKQPLTIEINNSNDDSNLSDELETTVKKLHNKQKHTEVVRLCSNLSRPLWISGKYKQRITIGSFYEDSATIINDTKHQISALIDDLGWTNAVVGNIKDAIDNIKQGIAIALKNDEWYLASKAYRHLGTIELRYSLNIEQAENNFQEAIKIAKNIKSDIKKREMLSGIYFNLSELYLQSNKIEESFDYANKSKKILESLEDEIRLLKVNSQIGRILLAKNTTEDIKMAKTIFNTTLKKAKNLSRPDEVGKCLLGLGEIHLINGKKDIAINTLNNAINVFAEIKAVKEINKANELLIKATSIKNF